MLEDGKKILKLFPLPIFHYRIKDHKKHNENLSKYIYNLYKNDKSGLKRSNQGGWHPKPFDLKKKMMHLSIFFWIYKNMWLMFSESMVGYILQEKLILLRCGQ